MAFSGAAGAAGLALLTAVTTRSLPLTMAAGITAIWVLRHVTGA